MNLKNVTRLLATYYESLPDTDLTTNEENYAKQLQELINERTHLEITNDLVFESDEENYLEIDFKTYYENYSSDQSDSSDDQSSNASQQESDESVKSYIPSSSPVRKARKLPKFTLPLDRIKEIVSYSTKADGSWRSASTVTNRFRKEFNECTNDLSVKRKLNRFKNQLEKQGQVKNTYKDTFTLELPIFCKNKREK